MKRAISVEVASETPRTTCLKRKSTIMNHSKWSSLLMVAIMILLVPFARSEAPPNSASLTAIVKQINSAKGMEVDGDEGKRTRKVYEVVSASPEKLTIKSAPNVFTFPLRELSSNVVIEDVAETVTRNSGANALNFKGYTVYVTTRDGKKTILNETSQVSLARLVICSFLDMNDAKKFAADLHAYLETLR